MPSEDNISSEHLLKTVRDFADLAHGDQQRKYENARYIVHPVRVMETCKKYTDDNAILAAALLHDVLEDTPMSPAQLSEFLSGIFGSEDAKRTISYVIELTDVFTKSKYPRLNRRSRKELERKRLGKISQAAQTIKYADIIDNAQDVARNDPDFAQVFLKEYLLLLKNIPEGNNELYQVAETTVKNALRSL